LRSPITRMVSKKRADKPKGDEGPGRAAARPIMRGLG
jgi:hypothetical protein